MRPTSRTPSVAGRIAAAILLSLGLHGLIVLGVWFAPVSAPTSTAAVDPTQVPQDYPALGLDDAPPPRIPVPPPKRPDPDVKPASFDVKVVDPPPAAPGPAAPIAAGPGAAAPAAGPAPAATAGMGDGSGDGGPCPARRKRCKNSRLCRGSLHEHGLSRRPGPRPPGSPRQPAPPAADRPLPGHRLQP